MGLHRTLVRTCMYTYIRGCLHVRFSPLCVFISCTCMKLYTTIYNAYNHSYFLKKKSAKKRYFKSRNFLYSEKRYFRKEFRYCKLSERIAHSPFTIVRPHSVHYFSCHRYQINGAVQHFSTPLYVCIYSGMFEYAPESFISIHLQLRV